MSESSKKEQVRQMFNNISGKYDFLNHFLSLGIDIRWRKKVRKLVEKKEVSRILDVATGTADLAIELSKIPGVHVIGIDIADQMLDRGRIKIRQKNINDRVELLNGDSENLLFDDASFDVCTVAFGVRNFENLQKGLAEMFRVLKEGGQIIVLEFSKPSAFPFKQLYAFYFRVILPGIGRMVSRDSSAYTYLPASVQKFPDGPAFLKELENCGFENARQKRLSLGISTIYSGTKPMGNNPKAKK